MHNNNDIIYEECMNSGFKYNCMTECGFFYKFYSYLAYDMKYV